MQLLSLLVDRGLVLSKSEARRSIAQGAIRVDGVAVRTDVLLSPGLHEIRVGRGIAHVIEVPVTEDPR